MNVRRVTASIAMGALAVACSSSSPGDREATAADRAPLRSVFADDFETIPTSWGKFEEIVGGNACYRGGIGSVDAVAVAGPRRGSTQSLRVLANAAASTYSNHVIAQKRLSPGAFTDRLLRYETWVMVDARAGDGIHEGQTGPEVSLQNTRLRAAGYCTATAGIQYIANKWAGQGSWQVWTGAAGGTVAAWTTLAIPPYRLVPGAWYRLVLEVDYQSNTYRQLTVTAAGQPQLNVDLTAYAVVDEIKFTEAAFWVTLESENAWSTCGGAYQYGVYYDDLRLDAF